MLAVAFISCAYAYAASGFSYLVQFQRHSYAQSGSPEGPDDYDFEGKRTPGKPVLGTIDTQNGVQIPGLDKSAVVSYELYEEDANMGTWYDETSFMSAIADYGGYMQIRINLPQYYLCGYAELSSDE